MRLKAILCATTLSALTAPSYAANLEMMKLTQNLATVLAAETYCELSYNQDVIAAFIEEHVAADDMEFAGNLQSTTSMKSYQLKDMSAASKVAHCTQIKRVAQSYGFTE
jgi:Tfp pilus assembly protein PilE